MPCCSRPRRAARSYTGADCSLAQCADTLHWISAGALLVESNWPEPLRDMATAKTTWANIFRAADLDGNEFLTLAEATRRLIDARRQGAAASQRLAWERQPTLIKQPAKLPTDASPYEPCAPGVPPALCAV